MKTHNAIYTIGTLLMMIGAFNVHIGITCLTFGLWLMTMAVFIELVKKEKSE